MPHYRCHGCGRTFKWCALIRHCRDTYCSDLFLATCISFNANGNPLCKLQRQIVTRNDTAAKGMSIPTLCAGAGGDGQPSRPPTLPATTSARSGQAKVCGQSEVGTRGGDLSARSGPPTIDAAPGEGSPRHEAEPPDRSRSHADCLSPRPGFQLRDWLLGLDAGHGALLQYTDALVREFDGDPSQIRAVWRRSDLGESKLDSVDPSFWVAVGVRSLGHKLTLARGITLLNEASVPYGHGQ